MCWSVPVEGALQSNFFQTIRVDYGSGWVVQVSLGFLLLLKIAINQYWYFEAVYHVYAVYIYIVKRC